MDSQPAFDSQTRPSDDSTSITSDFDETQVTRPRGLISDSYRSVGTLLLRVIFVRRMTMFPLALDTDLRVGSSSRVPAISTRRTGEETIMLRTSTLFRALRGPLLIGGLLSLAVASAAEAPASASIYSGHSSRDTLVDDVRRAIAPFAGGPGAGYAPATTCVSGPDHGAMGVHFVNGAFLNDNGNLEVDQPEALIYEPQPNGSMRLVGAEYIVFVKDWKPADHNGAATPSLEGHLMNLVDAPNRFGLDPFYEIHVWAIQENPQGAFADWNNHVTCEKQPVQ
jgi:hypothetical protein